MVAMRRSLLAGLMVAVVVLAGACSPPEPGSPEWLVGTWVHVPEEDDDVSENFVTFNAGGILRMVRGDDVKLFQYGVVAKPGGLFELSIFEIRSDGTVHSGRPTIRELSNCMPGSFALGKPGHRGRYGVFVRQ